MTRRLEFNTGPFFKNVLTDRIDNLDGWGFRKEEFNQLIEDGTLVEVEEREWGRFGVAVNEWVEVE